MHSTATLGDPLRVVSVNAYGAMNFFNAARLAALCKELMRLRPHVVCFQEVVRPWQVAVIRQHFSQTHATYTAPKERAGLINRGGLLTLVHRGRLTAEAPSFRTFSEQHDPKSPLTRADALLQKGVLTVSVRDERSHAGFDVLNTHLAAPYGKLPTAGPLQMSQLDELGRMLTPNLRRIICGDLNMTPMEIPSRSPLRLHREAFGFDETRITIDNRNPLRQGLIAGLSGRGSAKPDKRVDYIFASWGFVFERPSDLCLDRAVQYPNYRGMVTDHRAISAHVLMEY